MIFRRRSRLRLLLVAASAIAGCGHSVTPTAAYRQPASLPAALSVVAVQEPGAIVLGWNVSGDAYRYIDGWNVYRGSEMNGARVRLNPALVADITFRDASVEEGREYYYSVRSVSAAGVEGVPSHDLVVRYDRTPPPAPTGLVATPAPNAIGLAWTAAAAGDVSSYRVYRDGAPRAQGLAATDYTDMPVAPGIVHWYAVAAVDGNGNESARSDSVGAASLAAADTTPPAAPVALAAASLFAGIELTWAAPGDPDLQGYFVYRRGPGESLFARLIDVDLVTEPRFVDATVSSNGSYAYRVTAVDLSGNESQPSGEAVIEWLARRVDTGGATLGSVYPWCGIAYNSGRMQFVVPAGDIGRGGTIDTNGLWIQGGAAVYHNVTASLSHTTITALKATFAENRAVSGPPLVVFGPATVDLSSAAPGTVLALPLAAPFVYDGSSPLLLEISWNGDDNRTVVFSFASSPAGSRRLYAQPDGGSLRLEPYQQFLRFVFR
jgi:fibronectin type 3 domain-containing protein